MLGNPVKRCIEYRHLILLGSISVDIKVLINLYHCHKFSGIPDTVVPGSVLGERLYSTVQLHPLNHTVLVPVIGHIIDVQVLVLHILYSVSLYLVHCGTKDRQSDCSHHWRISTGVLTTKQTRTVQICSQ